jgi:hypothetical protein
MYADWASERTNFPSEVAEMALAHTVSSKVEKACRRGDLFERRRRNDGGVVDVLWHGASHSARQ